MDSGSSHERNYGHTPRVMRWLWAGLLALTIAGYPLVSGIPLVLGVPSRTVSVPYRAVVLSIALMLVWRGIGAGTLVFGREWLSLFFFWLLYLLRLLLDSYFFPVPLSLSHAEYFTFAFGLCLFPMLASFNAADGQTKAFALRLSLLAALLASISAVVVNVVTLFAGNLTTTVRTGRFSTATLDPISLGHLGASLALLCLVTLVSDRRRRAVPLSLAAVGMLIGVATVLASASRGPMLALTIVALMLVWTRFRRSPVMTKLVVLTIIAAIVVALMTAAVVLQHLGFAVLTRIAGATGDQSSAVHVSVAADAIREFARSPMLGSGLEEPISGSYPHNVIIESFMATGFFGGVAFCAMLAFGMRAGWRMVQRWNDETWIALIFWQQVIASVLAGSLYLSGGLWCLLGVVYTADRIYRSEHRSTSEFASRRSITWVAPRQVPG